MDSTPASHGSRTWSVGLALVVVAVGAALILGLTFPLTAAVAAVVAEVAEHWTPSAPGGTYWGRLLGGVYLLGVYALHTLAYAAGLAIAPAVAGLITGQAGLPTAGTLAAMAIGDYSAIPQLFEQAGRDQRCKSQAALGVRPSQPTSPAVEEQVYGLVRQNEPPVARSAAQVARPAPPGG